MSKKTTKSNVAEADVRQANDKPDVVHEPAADMGDLSADRDAERLFALFVSRVSTIDRFRIPITDKGFLSACSNAFDEAASALAVFNERIQK